MELIVQDLRKSFRAPSGAELEVLRGVSFQVAAGDMVAVCGASGAGKSTLLHAIGGLEAADGGTIEFGGLDLTRAGQARLARFRNESIGFVFQFHHLLADLTAAENVALPLAIGRTPSREIRLRRALEALKTVGLAERAAHAVGHLSGGEQQRVALARALVKRPALVLADEPTGNLDAQTGEEISRLLEAYCRTQRAIVLVATHNERLAEACDRALLLEEGKIKKN